MAVGRQFGSFTLIRKIARGGMADVFLATRRLNQLDELCVIKMMIPTTLRNLDALKMFLSEARLALSLDHPNIIKVFSLDRVDDYFFIAMEYVAGETVLNWINQAAQISRPTTPWEAAGIIHQCCLGLAYAHARSDGMGQKLNLVHRDISPSNLIVSYEGRAQILDFGIAAANRHLVSVSGKAIGKYGYMSPEQCRGEALDQRSDIFSLGIVFWELAAGRALFAGGDRQALKEAILSGAVSSPGEYNRKWTPALDSVIFKALAFRPEDRFQNAAEMADALLLACGSHLAGETDLNKTMLALFGKRNARLSRIGDIGEKLDLETMLFDDLQVEEDSHATAHGGDQNKRSRFPWLLVSFFGILTLALGILLGLFLLADEPEFQPATNHPVSPEVLGALLIDSTPKGARIYLEGADTGLTTPAKIDGIRLGQDREISLQNESFETWKTRIRLETQEPRRIFAILRPHAPPITSEH